MKRFARILIALIALCLAFSMAAVFAASPTDEILNYEITIDTNEDATLYMEYHLEWEVLESDGIGPVSWVEIGIPNSHVEDMIILGSNIKSLSYSSNYGSYIRVDFKKEYYKGEVIPIDFAVIQDYMYSINLYGDGKTVYQFTPGWFDEIAVDRISVRWNMENVDSWTPSCKQEANYLVWTGALRPGEVFETVQLSYPSDVLGFDSSKDFQNDYDQYDQGYEPDHRSGLASLFAGILPVVVWFFIIRAVIKRVRGKYSDGANFGASTKTKVTRTKVVYYPNCQSCGATRAEGETNCSYCGRSFIKSEEVIKEEEIPNEDKDALKYSEKGEFRYAPNTYVRVNVINVPVSRPHTSYSSSRPSRPSGGGCAHSSCACACASCACACACAGGGRAGCSKKDFYNTGLKLKQLDFRKKHKTSDK